MKVKGDIGARIRWEKRVRRKEKQEGKGQPKLGYKKSDGTYYSTCYTL